MIALLTTFASIKPFIPEKWLLYSPLLAPLFPFVLKNDRFTGGCLIFYCLLMNRRPKIFSTSNIRVFIWKKIYIAAKYFLFFILQTCFDLEKKNMTKNIEAKYYLHFLNFKCFHLAKKIWQNKIQAKYYSFLYLKYSNLFF